MDSITATTSPSAALLPESTTLTTTPARGARTSPSRLATPAFSPPPDSSRMSVSPATVTATSRPPGSGVAVARSGSGAPVSLTAPPESRTSPGPLAGSSRGKSPSLASDRKMSAVAARRGRSAAAESASATRSWRRSVSSGPGSRDATSSSTRSSTQPVWAFPARNSGCRRTEINREMLVSTP